MFFQDRERQQAQIGIVVEFAIALIGKLDGINRHSFNSFRLRVGECALLLGSFSINLSLTECYTALYPALLRLTQKPNKFPWLHRTWLAFMFLPWQKSPSLAQLLCCHVALRSVVEGNLPYQCEPIFYKLMYCNLRQKIWSSSVLWLSVMLRIMLSLI